MDRVTKSFLNKFSKEFSLESEENETILFEHFVNYTLVESKCYNSFNPESINIGIDGTIGIDGFALLLNGELIYTEDDLNEYMDASKKCSAEVIFIQAKTSSKFESKEIENLSSAVEDFISEVQRLKWSSFALEKISLLNKLIERSSELSDGPICNLFYVSLGRNEKDQNNTAKMDMGKERISRENIFSKITFDLYGATDIQAKYKKIGETISKSFEFPSRTTFPIINNAKEAYIGIVDAKTIIHLMTDEDGVLLENVFYDNVRDFQGSKNKVNIEIEKTIRSDEKDSFAILNNGITIVAEDLKPHRDTFTIFNYQIINGCQTSHVLFENKEYLSSNIHVPIKLIISENEELTSKIIRSTNRQTEVKEQDLLAFSDFQKQLEDYYSTFSPDDRLYYERRSKQYNKTTVQRKKIIAKTTQIKSVASMFYDKPEVATRYFGKLYDEFGNKLFRDNHQKYPYYVAAYAIYKIESLFSLKKLDKKYTKIKYHLIMMLRYEIDDLKCPSFESKKSIRYCENIFEVLHDENTLMRKLKDVIEKVDSLDFDLDNNEISKSKEFVKKCLAFYKK